ncbi:prephenate dehydratase [Williamsia serinedens]|uniref:Prephenate dehydratase n=1 Tax=Williamsia serinedens TaxID=391736 RepID=A0ABT1GY47_9NOCA|nr:prephenate dehydratase [Williamsia serinedens]
MNYAEPVPAVAYFGPAGTFTEMALDRLLADVVPGVDGLDVPADAERLPQTSPRAVIEAVRSGAADFGCVPMESSVEGAVPATMDALATGAPVQIVAEVVIDIAFTVAARATLEPDTVTTIAAYPVAAGQTRESIERLFPAATVVPASSNAAAASDVATGGADAALTTPIAARTHGLVPLAENVADAADATTRFVLLSRPVPVPTRTGDDRTSVIIDLPNVPGSLMRAMREFADREIDLTRIESRPRRTARGYFFFLDAVGHIDDAPMAQALAGLHAHAGVSFLGSWPADRGNGEPPPDTRGSLAWVEGLREGKR